ncbi:S-adenosyl-L-methionine-dependent methyltransferase [Schizopora paradoxa]|uniref:S-adenosyl-L-methionine-dependent methyltransferase n=1 Tax=Schizopora paradoxa TaxID=27342 RepID=A0A0H2S892_9AGAM|nr:S-adenosyl-L-methionine-dependent methyltransferase [Schizopora paradoxa]
MIPTPDTSHLTNADFEHVYEPAEDTFILLDALEADAERLRALTPRIAMEIGSGSGCVSAFLGAVLGSTTCLYLSTDINPHAALCTLKTGGQNKVPLEPVVTSLIGPFAKRLHRAVDVLIFNPPYVPTEDEEMTDAQAGRAIEGSWAGGKQGMLVTERVLCGLDEILSEKGLFYLVAVKDNDVPSIRRRMDEEYGFESDIVLQRRAGREHLFVIRFSRKASPS